MYWELRVAAAAAAVCYLLQSISFSYHTSSPRKGIPVVNDYKNTSLLDFYADGISPGVHLQDPQRVFATGISYETEALFDKA